MADTRTRIIQVPDVPTTIEWDAATVQRVTQAIGAELADGSKKHKYLQAGTPQGEDEALIDCKDLVYEDGNSQRSYRWALNEKDVIWGYKAHDSIAYFETITHSFSNVSYAKSEGWFFNGEYMSPLLIDAPYMLEKTIGIVEGEVS
jgi:hypothetical protein